MKSRTQETEARRSGNQGQPRLQEILSKDPLPQGKQQQQQEERGGGGKEGERSWL